MKPQRRAANIGWCSTGSPSAFSVVVKKEAQTIVVVVVVVLVSEETLVLVVVSGICCSTGVPNISYCSTGRPKCCCRLFTGKYEEWQERVPRLITGDVNVLTQIVEDHHTKENVMASLKSR